MQLDAASRTPEAAISAASGEQDIEPDELKAIAAKIVVTKITFYYGAYRGVCRSKNVSTVRASVRNRIEIGENEPARVVT